MDKNLTAPADLFELRTSPEGLKLIELRALTLGLPPKAVRRNLELYFEEWSSSGVDAWNQLTKSAEVFLVGDEPVQEVQRPLGWWNLPEVLGDRFIARLLNAPAGTCIMIPNATLAFFGVLSCRELQRPGKRNIVCTDWDFPSVVHTISQEIHRFDHFDSSTRDAVAFKKRIVSLGEGAFCADTIISAIDDSTALVALSHVSFIRGERVLDVEVQRIVEAAHAHGALVCIDGYHALGGHVIDVQALGVDLYFGGLLKEGCGASGACFLYIREGLDLTPALSGWFADEAPFAFHLEPQVHHEVRRRFLTGTTPVASLYHGVEGAKIMLRYGLERVAQENLDKVAAFVSVVQAHGVRVVSPTDRERMSALVVLEIEEANLFREALIDQFRVYTDARKNTYIRLAPHLYNAHDEIVAAGKAIGELYSTQRYRTHVPRQRVGPVT